MGGQKSKFEEGALVETRIDFTKINEEQKVEFELPFHTMRLDTFEARIKKYIY